MVAGSTRSASSASRAWLGSTWESRRLAWPADDGTGHAEQGLRGLRAWAVTPRAGRCHLALSHALAGRLDEGERIARRLNQRIPDHAGVGTVALARWRRSFFGGRSARGPVAGSEPIIPGPRRLDLVRGRHLAAVAGAGRSSARPGDRRQRSAGARRALTRLGAQACEHRRSRDPPLYLGVPRSRSLAAASEASRRRTAGDSASTALDPLAPTARRGLRLPSRRGRGVKEALPGFGGEPTMDAQIRQMFLSRHLLWGGLPGKEAGRAGARYALPRGWGMARRLIRQRR